MPAPEPLVAAIIDDDPSVRRLLASIITRAGDIVIEGGSIADGERLLREYPWDVAIIDRGLPDGDGIELCRGVSKGTTDSHRYVIVLSAADSHEDKLLGFEAGADEYIGKPIDASELAARLRAIRRTVAAQKTLLARMSELEQLSVIDGLTQVYNYRFFDAEVRRQFDLSIRHQRALGLVMIDLDHFKNINDAHGHPVGDHVLVEVSTIIAQRIRSCDVLARYGGEEFAVILPETAIEESMTIAERLRQSIEETPIDTTAGAIRLTISVGVGAFPSRTVDSPARLVEVADQALYEAKTNGRNCVKCGLPAEAQRREIWPTSSDPAAA